MRRPQVFISHSSRGRDIDRRLEPFVRALDRAGFDPLYDKRDIATGEDWRSKLDQLLKRCDAAIVLIDQAAMASDFVEYEMTILDFRRRNYRSFRFFPCKLDLDLRDKEVAERFKVLDLGSVQMWRPSPGQTAEEEIAHAFIAHITPLIPAPNPFDDGRGKILDRLKRELGTLDPDGLQQAIEWAGLEDEPLFAGIGAASGERVASLVAHWIVGEAAQTLDQVKRLVKQLPGENLGQRSNLMELIRGAESYWIEPAPDCPLQSAARGTPPGGCVAVNGAYVPSYTAQALAMRAIAPDKLRLVRCDAGCTTVEAVRGEIHAFFRNRDTGGFSDDPDPDDYVRRHTQDTVTVCVLPQGAAQGCADTHLVEDLTNAFPAVVFVIAAGPVLRREYIPRNVGIVTPEVALDREKSRRDSWDTFRVLFQ